MSWYTFESDRRGVTTTRVDLAGGPFWTGAAGTRLLQQLLALGFSDAELRRARGSDRVARRSADLGVEAGGPAHRKKDEGTVMVECYLRALGLSWEEAKTRGAVYRPPKSSTADLSAYRFAGAHWPSRRVGDGQP